MNNVRFENGKIVLEAESHKSRVLDFGERLMLKSLIDLYIVYDLRFKAEAADMLKRERAILNTYINENNAEEYYKASIYDNRISFINNLCAYVNMEYDDNITPSIIISALLKLERDRNDHDLRAEKCNIKNIEIYFYICSEISRYISDFLYKNGYEEIPVPIETYIDIYRNIINDNSKIIKFVGSEHEKDYNNLVLLLTNTLMHEEITNIENYVKMVI